MVTRPADGHSRSGHDSQSCAGTRNPEAEGRAEPSLSPDSLGRPRPIRRPANLARTFGPILVRRERRLWNCCPASEVSAGPFVVVSGDVVRWARLEGCKSSLACRDLVTSPKRSGRDDMGNVSDGDDVLLVDAVSVIDPVAPPTPSNHNGGSAISLQAAATPLPQRRHRGSLGGGELKSSWPSLHAACLRPADREMMQPRPVSKQKGAPAQADVESGLSQFVARVLGQLTLGAWLPAALFVSVGALVTQFAIQGSVSLGPAISALLSDKWAFVILSVPVLVLATLVTQAFSFEAIRALEGYWTRRSPLAPASRVLINAHLHRKNKTRDRRLALSHQAFLVSRSAWLEAGFSTQVVNALEKASLDLDNEPEQALLTAEELDTFEHLNWRSKCSPSDMAKIDDLGRIEEDYPADHRVLPTRLGNVMRATEDRLFGASDDLEGFALRQRDKASARVQLQHDEFRTRLDMYCTLVFVSILLATSSLAALGWSATHQPQWRPDDTGWSIAIVGSLLLLAWVSYLAAIASARGYLTALVQMDQLPPTLSQPADRTEDKPS